MSSEPLTQEQAEVRILMEHISTLSQQHAHELVQVRIAHARELTQALEERDAALRAIQDQDGGVKEDGPT